MNLPTRRDAVRVFYPVRFASTVVYAETYRPIDGEIGSLSPYLAALPPCSPTP
jgi:hypothetical protein